MPVFFSVAAAQIYECRVGKKSARWRHPTKKKRRHRAENKKKDATLDLNRVFCQRIHSLGRSHWGKKARTCWHVSRSPLCKTNVTHDMKTFSGIKCTQWLRSAIPPNEKVHRYPTPNAAVISPFLKETKNYCGKMSERSGEFFLGCDGESMGMAGRKKFAAISVVHPLAPRDRHALSLGEKNAIGPLCRLAANPFISCTKKVHWNGETKKETFGMWMQGRAADLDDMGDILTHDAHPVEVNVGKQ